MASPVLLAKAASLLLTDEDTRKKVGWVVAMILSPLILLAAFFCALGAGTADHNTTAVEVCFHGGTIPDNVPEEYRVCLEAMRDSLSSLDEVTAGLNRQMEEGASLDADRVKAIFYALYFGAEIPGDLQSFADCFVTYEERTRTVTAEDENGVPVETEESYTVAIPIEDEAVIWQNIAAAMGVEVTAELQGNANSVYSMAKYGYTSDSGFEGSDTPFIGADGFCSPVGGNWRGLVTSEFGNRKDPITGKRKGHTGMDLAVPTGTPVRAALPGTVTVSKYNAGGYGYYVMIDHGDGLVTLYGHNSKLIAKAGQTVQAGDVVALSGSTGRSTGPHLHFEVRVNGERTDPRGYLP